MKKEIKVEIEYCRFCGKPYKANGKCLEYKGMLAQELITECNECFKKMIAQMKS